MSRKYHIWTMGCQMNEADSRHLGSQLEALGYDQVEKPDGADLVVMNTCVVRQQAEDKAVGKLTHMKKFKARNPEMIVGLMGCMVGMRESKRLQKQFPFVDVFMPPSDTRPLMEYLGDNQLDQITKNEETRDKAVHNAVQDEDYILPALQRSKTVIANVPIVLGCSHACTFCIIPYRRGAERSKTREEILREVQKLTEQGVREVMLLGQIVDRYGCDFEHDYDLADLLVDVAGNENLFRVRFLTSHPNWMTDKLIDTVAQHPKLCPHFEVPVQAGNDEVLENMKREYTVEDFRQLVGRIRKRIPDATINTDIIVGFPGESEAQYQDTYDLLKELELDKIHLAKYSERPKTIAERKMTDDVTSVEKERRRKTIDELNEVILTRTNEQWMGQTVEVLVEEKRKERWKGRTPHNRLVFFDSDENLLGALVKVKIEWTGPYTLIGQLEEVLVGPSKVPTPIEIVSSC